MEITRATVGEIIIKENCDLPYAIYKAFNDFRKIATKPQDIDTFAFELDKYIRALIWHTCERETETWEDKREENV